MAVTVPPIPLKSPVIDGRGLLSSAWSGFFRELYKRIGESRALSNIEIETQISGISAATIIQIQSDITAIEVVNTTQDASISSLNSQMLAVQKDIEFLLKAPVPE